MEKPIIKFIINNKDFWCDTDLFSADQFIVKSIPRPYTVTCDDHENLFSAIIALVNQREKNLLLIDSKLLEIYKPIFNIDARRIFVAKAHENFKTWENVTTLIHFLQKNELTKSDQLIVVGGGTIQDIASFVCGIYKRGIPFIYFPSTLLSMCDSCIGGKANVNYDGIKNQLAIFSAPFSVYINPVFLQTLSDHDIKSGLGEILKACILGGSYFIDLYKAHVIYGKVKSFSSFKKLIMAALCVKKAVVEEDEFELNYRRSLNYGHTLGHAIEALSGYAIPHGQAVVIGAMLANQVSYARGLLSKENLSVINALCFDLINEPVLACLKKINLATMINILQKDKKTMGEYVGFVLLKSPGEVCITEIKLDEILLCDIRVAFKKLQEY